MPPFEKTIQALGITMTQHAEQRMRQRGIDGLRVAVLHAFGQTSHRHGAEVRYLSRRRALKASRQLRKLADDLGKLADTYIVEDEGNLITVAHREHNAGARAIHKSTQRGGR